MINCALPNGELYAEMYRLVSTAYPSPTSYIYERRANIHSRLPLELQAGVKRTKRCVFLSFTFAHIFLLNIFNGFLVFSL